VIIPAFNAQNTIGSLIAEARAHFASVIVIDDGSTDQTREIASNSGAIVLFHDHNRGKGAALKTGLRHARSLAIARTVTMDADGQHLVPEAARLGAIDFEGLVLAVRDLKAAGAPWPNQAANAFARGFLSMVTMRRLRDTQCGLRVYPVAATLDLDVEEDGFAFETVVLLRAIWAKIPLYFADARVVYPPNRTTTFDANRDPWRIVDRVLRALLLPRRR
jgi:glycosyltransferase involved in cell wall biosynthesis